MNSDSLGALPDSTHPAATAPQRKRHRGLIIGVAAAAVVVVGAAVIAVVLLVTRGESSATMALDAGRAIAPSAGLSFTGTTAGGSATLTVTRAGTVEGSYTQEGDRVGIIMINGVAYLKTPATFWVDEDIDPGTAGQAAGRWAKAPPQDVNLSFAALTPGHISHALEHVGSNPRATTLDRGKVIKLAAGGASYYITTATPNRLIRVAGGGGMTAYSLSVTPLGAAAIGPVFTVLHADVAQLRGAADPTAVIDPAAKIHFGSNCSGSTSCTVSNKVLVTDPDSPATHLTMIVYFAVTKDGKPFATCTDKVWAATGGVLAGVTVTPSCGLSGSVWSNWVDSHSTSFTTWAGSAFESSVNSASDIERLQSDLDQQQGR
jgi:hypothetical protein